MARRGESAASVSPRRVSSPGGLEADASSASPSHPALSGRAPTPLSVASSPCRARAPSRAPSAGARAPGGLSPALGPEGAPGGPARAPAEGVDVFSVSGNSFIPIQRQKYTRALKYECAPDITRRGATNAPII